MYHFILRVLICRIYTSNKFAFLFVNSYLISGDADGKLYIWDWKTTKLYNKFKAHDDVCVGALWHPHETSKVATCGWDGVIKYWDWGYNVVISDGSFLRQMMTRCSRQLCRTQYVCRLPRTRARIIRENGNYWELALQIHYSVYKKGKSILMEWKVNNIHFLLSALEMHYFVYLKCLS